LLTKRFSFLTATTACSTLSLPVTSQVRRQYPDAHRWSLRRLPSSRHNALRRNATARSSTGRQPPDSQEGAARSGRRDCLRCSRSHRFTDFEEVTKPAFLGVVCPVPRRGKWFRVLHAGEAFQGPRGNVYSFVERQKMRREIGRGLLLQFADEAGSNQAPW